MLSGEQFGRYEIRTKIGEGGMGEVYSAHDLELDRSVAIKLLPNEFMSDEDRRVRFKQEARVVSALNHPNIITIYEVGDNEYGSFLATEFVEGTTLREIIKRESMTLTRILKIIEQAANALVAAHAAQIIHRDIKPENIMVRRDSIVKVLDFGLAKPPINVDDGTSESSKTIPGTVMGSARYMSPEQARGHVVDERTDIWSLGVVLYEMLAGSAPFNGDSTADTLAAVIYYEPEPIHNLLPNAPLELSRILRKALQKDREERYQSVKDLALDIKDLLYEIEHANSGDRSGHIISAPDISENPTIIHRTISGKHPTDRNYGLVSGRSYSVQNQQGRSRWKIGVGSAALVVLLAAIGLGFYGWFGTERELADSAFVRPQMSRINTDGRVLSPAISPDGKYVAYVSGELGNRSLVVRQVSTDSTVTVVPPTNLNLHSLAFSPNGDYVYYSQTRSDFAVNTLYQVPTFGGTSKKLIDDVDSTVTFSPDGKQFAFMRHVSSTNEDVIFVTDSVTLESTELLRSKQTDFDFFSTRLAWSPNGQTILLGTGKREGGFVSNMAIAEIDVGEKKLRVVNDGKFFTVGNFVWFADGSGFLCAGRESQSSPVQIWRSSYPKANFHQVTNDFNDYAEVGLSADGSTIITLKGDTISSLWKVRPNGGDSQQLTTENRNLEGQWGMLQRKDGTVIYSRKDGKESNLWTANGDGKDEKALFAEKGFSVSPAVTPDGKYVVFNLQREKSSRIWRMDADGENPVQLTAEDPNVSDFSPQITADGKTVIFQRAESNQERVSLMKVPIDGGKAEPFYSVEDWNVFQPRLSPDGKRMAYIAYNVHTWEKKLQLATVNGDKFESVERDLDYNLVNQVAWAPDSRSLTILSNRNGTQNIWRLPIDGGPAVPMTNFKSGRVLNFAWSADGRELLIARGNTNNDLILIRDSVEGTNRDALTRTQKARADRRA